jgi:hypothetical protein
MKIFLLIRRTKAWYEGRVDLSTITRHSAEVERAVGTWQRRMGYLPFRHALRRIAQKTLNGFDGVVQWSDQDAVASLPRDAWLIPLDEDDWLHPNFVRVVKSHKVPDDTMVLTWDVQRKEADGRVLQEKNRFVESCGYALRTPADWLTITNHMLVPGDGKVFHIPRLLAVRNETPASVGFLIKNGNPDAAITAALKTSAAAHFQLPPWARLQFHTYTRLLEEL